MIAAAIASASEWFAAPAAGLALVGVALVALALAMMARRKARRLAAVVGPRAPQLAAERSELRERLQRRLCIVGLAFAVLAWMQPLVLPAAAMATPPAADLCICLDVSRSMLAGDLAPTRLAFAQQAIAELGARTRGDRLALVVFAGEPRLRVPLTRDVDSLVEIARGVEPSDVLLGGTDLAAAIDAGVAALAAARRANPTDVTPGAILLITDGEDARGEGRAAAARARGQGIAVHCIGTGSTLGSKITITGAGGRQSFLRDRDGNEVLTRLDASTLRALAGAGGGLYVDAGATTAPLVTTYERGIVPTLAARHIDEALGRERGNGFQLPLGLAVVVLLVELAMSARRRRDAAFVTGGAV